VLKFLRECVSPAGDPGTVLVTGDGSPKCRLSLPWRLRRLKSRHRMLLHERIRGGLPRSEALKKGFVRSCWACSPLFGRDIPFQSFRVDA
jgi:hypothetical protein